MRGLAVLIWTACAAGWAVIWLLTHLPEAFIVAGACGLVAWAWHSFMGDEDGN